MNPEKRSAVACPRSMRTACSQKPALAGPNGRGVYRLSPVCGSRPTIGSKYEDPPKIKELPDRS